MNDDLIKARDTLNIILENIKREGPCGSKGITWDYSDDLYHKALEFVIFHGSTILSCIQEDKESE